jgi:hypothetical protein
MSILNLSFFQKNAIFADQMLIAVVLLINLLKSIN